MKKVAFLLSLTVFLTVSCAKNELEPQGTVEKEPEAPIPSVNFTPCQHNKLKSAELSSKVAVEFTNIDVTKLVQDMINDKDGSYGFLLKLQVEQPYNSILFASNRYQDENLRPKLEVHYKIKK